MKVEAGWRGGKGERMGDISNNVNDFLKNLSELNHWKTIIVKVSSYSYFEFTSRNY